MTNFLVRITVGKKDAGTPDGRGAYVNLASVVGIITNTSLAIVKLVVGLLVGSVSIVADAANNATDSLTNLMVIIGIRLSKKPADSEHPFGHARAEYIVSLAISALILFLGYELTRGSIGQIVEPAEMELSRAAMWVLAGTALVKVWQALFYAKLGKKIDSDPLKALSRDSMNDVLVGAAIVGSLAFTYLTGWVVDGFAALAVSLLVMYSGISMAKETVSKLIGESAAHEQALEIEKIVLSHGEILSVHDMVVHSYGPGKSMPTLHVEMSDELSLKEAHSVVDEIERKAKSQLGVDLLIHIDPVSPGHHRLEHVREELSAYIAGLGMGAGIKALSMSKGETKTDIRFELDFPDGMAPERKDEIRALASQKVRALSGTYNPKIRLGNSYVVPPKKKPEKP